MPVLAQIKIRMGMTHLLWSFFVLDSKWAISITFTSDPSMRVDEAHSEMELEFKVIMTVAEGERREKVTEFSWKVC